MADEWNRDRVRKALMEYDGDACRPECGLTPQEIAHIVLVLHWDLATCFCPTCVLARVFLDTFRPSDHSWGLAIDVMPEETDG